MVALVEDDGANLCFNTSHDARDLVLKNALNRPRLFQDIAKSVCKVPLPKRTQQRVASVHFYDTNARDAHLKHTRTLRSLVGFSRCICGALPLLVDRSPDNEVPTGVFVDS